MKVREVVFDELGELGTTNLSTLIRNLRIGERLSFDNGRIVLGLDGNSPKTARLRLTLHEDVVVDKPRVATKAQAHWSRASVAAAALFLALDPRL
ncbi:hypothetical protein WKW80_05910 [Variovorax humicola]|uniref:Uncharacterized protein n=1 Tax=Variovorax humicola TaxID=1769758 RepID=A0ABU8VUS9_9BURK